MVRNAKDRKSRQRESLLRSVEGFSKPETPAPASGTEPAEKPQPAAGADAKPQAAPPERKTPERKTPAPVRTTAAKPVTGTRAAEPDGPTHVTAGERRAAEHGDRRNFTLPSGAVYRSFTSRLTLENMKTLKRVAVEMDTSIQSVVNALIEEGLNQGRCDLHTVNRFLER